MQVRDLADEAAAGIAARPSRLVLTTLGTVLGIAALVATLGLAQTAGGQIAEHFDAIAATSVSLEAREEQTPTGPRAATQLPWDAEERLARLNGVTATGTMSESEVGDAKTRTVPVIDPVGEHEHDLPVVAASPGLLDAVDGTLTTGRWFDRGHDERADRVAVLGALAAERLAIARVDNQPTVFVGDEAFIVIGIIEESRRTLLLDAVIVPDGTAAEVFDLQGPAEVLVRTRLGAAELIGRQGPVALSPNDPTLVVASVPPSPGRVRERVQSDVNALFLVLGGVALLVGGLGIANVTLLGVLERIGEIGLRRALGATRRAVAAQFLVESTGLGLLGGLVGAAAGVLVTVAVSASRQWTPILDVRLAVLAPALGAAIGLVAGSYPAWRASAVEPIAALRSL